MTLNPTVDPHATIAVRRVLDEAADRRRRQLAELPPDEGDLVAAAHRDSVERILGEIQAALHRLDAGTYGSCLRCRGTIPRERMRLRPWTAFCVQCATR